MTVAQRQRLAGFELVRNDHLPALEADAFELRHEATGARLLHLATDDAENHLSAAIPARVDNDTGWTHVLEHCVMYARTRRYSRAELRGGRKWLASNIGAWTGADFTHYGVASPDAGAFRELVDVLCEQLFEPELDDEVFWNQIRLDFEQPGDPSAPLTYRGIIYNEQKGVSGLGLLGAWDALVGALFPGSHYRHASGGRFVDMPALTPERIRSQHARHYRPGRAHFVSWGPAPLADIAAAFDSALRRVPERPAATPRETEVTVLHRPAAQVLRLPSVPAAAAAERQVLVGWATVDWADAYQVFLHELAVEALLRDPAGPVRLALLESGLGSGLADTLYDYGWRPLRHIFAAGLKGAGEKDAAAVEEIVLDALRRPLSPDAVRPALRRLELRRRLAEPGWPPAMLLLTSVLPAWILGGDPVAVLDWEAHAARLAAEPGALDEFIATRLVASPSRARIVVEPDPDGIENLLQRERANLQAARAELDRSGPHVIAAAGRRVAERASAEEAELAAAPPPSTHGLDSRVAAPELGPPPLLLIQRGVAHLELAIGLDGIPADLQPLLGPLVIALERGGLRAAVEALVDADAGRFRPRLRVSVNGLEREQAELRRRLAAALDHVQAGPELIAAARAAAESSLFRRAHEMVVTLAAASLRSSASLLERASGFEQLQLERGDPRELLALVRIEDEPVANADEAPAGAPRSRARTWGQPASFNAQVHRTRGLGAPETAALAVAAAYAHELARAEVQVEGTAYHAGARLDTEAGCLVLWSVRDPHVERTYAAFDAALAKLAKGDLEERRLQQARAAAWRLAAGEHDRVAQARLARADQQRGIAPEARTRFRERILAVEPAAVAAAVTGLGEPARATLGPADRLAELRGSLFDEVR